ncbi:MAG: triphosphoribosyl-dephospho-CoA synthase [Acholeplasmataceae bacterium]|jgi:holo-ACP synthase/triphosphoribosyl-dephospho-CoA synthase
MEKIIFERESYYQNIFDNLKDYDVCINLSVNGPGNSKYSNEAKLLISYFDKLIDYYYLKKEVSNTAQGLQITYYLKDVTAKEVKEEMVKLEDNHPLGRFIDLDVFERDNPVSLSRNRLRKCYLCDEPAFVCQRNRTHRLTDLEIYFKREVLNFLGEEISRLVEKSILLELNLHPKFGLVTPYTSGSHYDMNYDLMLKGAKSIIPFLREMFKAVPRITNPLELIINNQVIGVIAEKQMLKATNGVNCYKGLIYNLGVLITASTFAIINLEDYDYTYIFAKEMAKETFNQNDFNTYGEKVYQKYSFGGIREEAMSGFPSVQKVLPLLDNFEDKTLLKALVKLIIKTNDTVLLKRSGSLDNLKQIKKKFKSLNIDDMDEVNELSDYCIENNLSFGGSADLLTTSIYLKKMQEIFSFIQL